MTGERGGRPFDGERGNKKKKITVWAAASIVRKKVNRKKSKRKKEKGQERIRCKWGGAPPSRSVDAHKSPENGAISGSHFGYPGKKKENARSKKGTNKSKCSKIKKKKKKIDLSVRATTGEREKANPRGEKKRQRGEI